ncbi:hypothetical protein HDU93_002140 [Gonapodya sp. JEL0774]|nr:hypothetical protein HDU93_002140 [Gonapodya sp. JEL0774]
MRIPSARKRKAVDDEDNCVYPDIDIEELETLYGFVDTVEDCLLVLQGCRDGLLNRVTSRLTETQRVGIRSGSVFVFNEEESNIKRWTDGRTWSPSRVLGQFLIYRELQRKHPISVSVTPHREDRRRPPPGDQARDVVDPAEAGSTEAPHTMSPEQASMYPKRNLRNHEPKDYAEDLSEGEAPSSADSGSPVAPPTLPLSLPSPHSQVETTEEGLFDLSDGAMRRKKSLRATGVDLATLTEMHMPLPFLGASANTFLYKPDGLIKKTISISLNDVIYHLVSYYSLSDLASGAIRTPTHAVAALQSVSPPEEYQVRMGKGTTVSKKRKMNESQSEQQETDSSFVHSSSLDNVRRDANSIRFGDQVTLEITDFSLDEDQSRSQQQTSDIQYLQARFGQAQYSQSQLPSAQFAAIPSKAEFTLPQLSVTAGYQTAPSWVVTNSPYQSTLHPSWNSTATAVPSRRTSSSTSNAEQYIVSSVPSVVQQGGTRVVLQTMMPVSTQHVGAVPQRVNVPSGGSNFIIASSNVGSQGIQYTPPNPVHIHINNTPSPQPQSAPGIVVSHRNSLSLGSQLPGSDTMSAPSNLSMQTISGVNLWTPRLDSKSNTIPISSGNISPGMIAGHWPVQSDNQHGNHRDSLLDEILAVPFGMKSLAGGSGHLMYQRFDDEPTTAPEPDPCVASVEETGTSRGVDGFGSVSVVVEVRSEPDVVGEGEEEAVGLSATPFRAVVLATPAVVVSTNPSPIVAKDVAAGETVTVKLPACAVVAVALELVVLESADCVLDGRLPVDQVPVSVVFPVDRVVPVWFPPIEILVLASGIVVVRLWLAIAVESCGRRTVVVAKVALLEVVVAVAFAAGESVVGDVDVLGDELAVAVAFNPPDAVAVAVARTVALVPLVPLLTLLPRVPFHVPSHPASHQHTSSPYISMVVFVVFMVVTVVEVELDSVPSGKKTTVSTGGKAKVKVNGDGVDVKVDVEVVVSTEFVGTEMGEVEGDEGGRDVVEVRLEVELEMVDGGAVVFALAVDVAVADTFVVVVTFVNVSFGNHTGTVGSAPIDTVATVDPFRRPRIWTRPWRNKVARRRVKSEAFVEVMVRFPSGERVMWRALVGTGSVVVVAFKGVVEVVLDPRLRVVIVLVGVVDVVFDPRVRVALLNGTVTDVADGAFTDVALEAFRALPLIMGLDSFVIGFIMESDALPYETDHTRSEKVKEKVESSETRETVSFEIVTFVELVLVHDEVVSFLIAVRLRRLNWMETGEQAKLPVSFRRPVEMDALKVEFCAEEQKARKEQAAMRKNETDGKESMGICERAMGETFDCVLAGNGDERAMNDGWMDKTR